MRLVCLECSAIYEAPDDLFGPQPREVRCNRCGYQWTVIGTVAENPAEAASLSVGPPEPAASAPAPAPQAAPAVPSGPVEPGRNAARLADDPAGQLPPERPLPPSPPPRPVPVEPSAASTRSLLAGAPAGQQPIALPDGEERRLSHELDFGEPERHRRRRDESSATRRIAIAIILIVILAIIAAVIFKTEIVSAFPALQAAYARLGL